MSAQQSLVQAARVAVQSSDWAAARDMLQDVVTTPDTDSELLALLAWSLHRLGDVEGAHRTVDDALRRDARNLRASLLKADILAAMDAAREANVYYRAVVEIGGDQPDLPGDLIEGVRKAREIRSRLAGDIFTHLRGDLEKAGYDEASSSPRFVHALDLASGRRQPYMQQPRAFFFPELPQVQFYPREMFPWLDAIEAETEAITAELMAVLDEDANRFEPYLQTAPNLPSRSDYPLVDSMDWSACFLWKDGRETLNAARCPRTMAALKDAPLCRVAGRSPQIMFSQLKAGAHIEPHTGFVNTRLVCHLPLIVPPDCRFRVGNDTRSWRKGKAWVFDDTIEHEAINQSDQTRVVLIFDIWRPELTEEERGLVATLLESIDAYSPSSTSWD